MANTASMPVPVKYNKTLNNGALAYRDIKLASDMHVLEKKKWQAIPGRNWQ